MPSKSKAQARFMAKAASDPSFVCRDCRETLPARCEVVTRHPQRTCRACWGRRLRMARAKLIDDNAKAKKDHTRGYATARA